jgi:hypothetical protein
MYCDDARKSGAVGRPAYGLNNLIKEIGLVGIYKRQITKPIRRRNLWRNLFFVSCICQMSHRICVLSRGGDGLKVTSFVEIKIVSTLLTVYGP